MAGPSLGKTGGRSGPVGDIARQHQGGCRLIGARYPGTESRTADFRLAHNRLGKVSLARSLATLPPHVEQICQALPGPLLLSALNQQRPPSSTRRTWSTLLHDTQRGPPTVAVLPP